MKIGFFGGTFDPVHWGHLTVAGEVRVKLELDRLLFVPAGQPWLKADRTVSPVAHRIAMISLAIAGNSHFEISTLEADRPGPSYTIDTIDALRHQMGNEARLFLIIGGDALADLPRWKEPSRLVRECHLVTFARPGSPVPNYASLEKDMPGISRHITLVEVSQVDISATQIRQRVSLGETLQGMVPAAVERYIREQGLYR